MQACRVCGRLGWLVFSLSLSLFLPLQCLLGCIACMRKSCTSCLLRSAARLCNVHVVWMDGWTCLSAFLPFCLPESFQVRSFVVERVGVCVGVSVAMTVTMEITARGVR